MDDVDKSDHLIVLAEVDRSNLKFGQLLFGMANDRGGKVAFLDADYFTGNYYTGKGFRGEQAAAYEFGHLTGLSHIIFTQEAMNLI